MFLPVGPLLQNLPAPDALPPGQAGPGPAVPQHCAGVGI